VYTITRLGDVCLILVEHDLDLSTSRLLASSIDLAAAGSQGRIVVSLEACTFCDASALTVLIRAKAVLGERLSIFVPPSNLVRRIFEITNLVVWLGLTSTILGAAPARPEFASEPFGEMTG
jgi:anti-anti-sigma factor